MAETKNLSIYYSKLFNIGLDIHAKMYPGSSDYPLIQTIIRQLRSLTALYDLLNNFPQFDEIMKELSYSSVLFKSLYVWKGKSHNQVKALKYFCVFVNILQDPSLRIPQNTWVSLYQALLASNQNAVAEVDVEQPVAVEYQQPTLDIENVDAAPIQKPKDEAQTAESDELAPETNYLNSLARNPEISFNEDFEYSFNFTFGVYDRESLW